MDSESNYDVEPVNNICNNITNKNIIVTTPGTSTNDASQNINTFNQQNIENTQYDTIENVNPLYGGNMFTLIFRNKKIFINGKNERKVIELFLKNKKEYKKDHIIQIINKNNFSIYKIKGNSNNKFRKIK
jgi:hypothetical protein